MSGRLHRWVFIRDAAKRCLDDAQKNEEGQFGNCISSLIFLYTGLEGYLYTLCHDLISIQSIFTQHSEKGEKHKAYMPDIESCGCKNKDLLGDYNLDTLYELLGEEIIKADFNSKTQLPNACELFQKIEKSLDFKNDRAYQENFKVIKDLLEIRNELIHPKSIRLDFSTKGMPGDITQFFEECWPTSKNFKPERVREYYEKIDRLMNYLNERVCGSSSNLITSLFSGVGHKRSET
ncbi:MAG TPA: hypothetical protein DIU37_05500 [Opitutae bacterium]|nr:hypothetical protein [Opitutae bacterium]